MMNDRLGDLLRVLPALPDENLLALVNYAETTFIRRTYTGKLCPMCEHPAKVEMKRQWSGSQCQFFKPYTEWGKRGLPLRQARSQDYDARCYCPDPCHR